MPSITARLLRVAMRARMKPAAEGDEFVAARRARINSGAAPNLFGRDITHRPIAVGELGPATGEWVGVADAQRHVVYLHGGYYVAGRTRPYRNLAARLAKGLGAEVWVLDYPLAPEHLPPAAIEHVLAAYRALLTRGIDPATVVIAGDSAGGGLTLAVLLRIKAEGDPIPGVGVAFSPWTDLTCSSASVDGNDRADDMLSAAALRTAAAIYGAGRDARDPEISPLFGELAGLPPLFVAVDRSEILLDDTVDLVERARAAGVLVELEQTTGLFHVWPVHVPYLREARDTVAKVAAFVTDESRPSPSSPPA